MEWHTPRPRCLIPHATIKTSLGTAPTANIALVQQINSPCIIVPPALFHDSLTAIGPLPRLLLFPGILFYSPEPVTTMG